MNFFLAISLVFTACLSESIEYLPFNIQVTFHLYQENNENWVSFSLQVPIDYKKVFGWIGIGIKNGFDPINSGPADFWVSITDGSTYDMFRSGTDIPVNDEDLGCINNIESSYNETEDYSIYLWKRKFYTGDALCDLVLKQNWPYVVVYEMGDLDSEGNILKAFERYSGFEYIVFKNDYNDDNTDERGMYGPWEEGLQQNF